MCAKQMVKKKAIVRRGLWGLALLVAVLLLPSCGGHTSDSAYWYHQGTMHSGERNYKEAERCFLRAVAIQEKEGPDHPYLARSLGDLGELYNGLGQYEKAEPHLKRALAILEKHSGADMSLPTFLLTQALHRLADSYEGLTQYGKAEELLRRALAVWEKEVGPDHNLTAKPLMALGILYFRQAQYGKAEPLMKRALEIEEKAWAAWGPENLFVVGSLHNMAWLYISWPNMRRLRNTRYGPWRPGKSPWDRNIAMWPSA